MASVQAAPAVQHPGASAMPAQMSQAQVQEMYMVRSFLSQIFYMRSPKPLELIESALANATA